MRPAGAAQIGRLCPRRGRDRLRALRDDRPLSRRSGDRNGGTLRPHGGDHGGVPPNFALAEYKAPENYPADVCPMCKAGLPITTF